MDKSDKLTSPWDYIDFELEIRKGVRRKYLVAVRSPEGEAQEEVRFPFSKRELQDKLKDLESAVLLSGRTRRRICSPEVQTAQNFGKALFRALFQGELGTHYELSLRAAKRQNKGLRLKLHIQPPELTVLPWEFLYDPTRDAYLCLSSKTPLVRYLELREPVEQLPVTPPLKILGMVASPGDLAPLDVENEKRRVEEAIKDLQGQGRVELTWLQGQTSRDLQRAMIRGPWHVFHFIGHGGFDPVGGEGLIALTNESGCARFLRAEDLAQLLKDHWDLRLVLLNSCEGARGGEQDAFSSTAAALVRPGIPAVLANQYEITDEAAIEFSRAFYQAVADGLPVDAAAAYARTSLKIEIDNTLEWVTPVLYMRSPDGRIFDISAEAPPVEPPEQPGGSEEDALRRYREGVESVWANGQLDRSEVEGLKELANDRLELSLSTAADIEREVMGDTKEVILERQTGVREEEERRKLLDELYTQARRSHQDQRWQAVVALFDQIHALDPAYPDLEELLVSAREALVAVGLSRKVAAMYNQGLRHVEAEEWPEALRCFEELQRLETGHRETERLLSRVRHELTNLPTVEVPNLSGQNAFQASSTLENRGPKLGARNRKASSETIPEGEIVSQSPKAGTEVEAGSLADATISSGPEKKAITAVPDVSDKNLEEARRVLSRTGLASGDSQIQESHKSAGTVVATDPPAGSEADVGTSITLLGSGSPRTSPAKPGFLPGKQKPRPDFLPGKEKSKPDPLPEQQGPRLDKPRGLPGRRSLTKNEGSSR